LLEFWIRFETALEEQRQLELLNDNATLHSLSMLETPWGIESHARDVYTHTIFSIFQDEVICARDKCDTQTMVQVGDERIARIMDKKKGRTQCRRLPALCGVWGSENNGWRRKN